MMNKTIIFSFILSCMLFASCNSMKKTTYFQEIDKSNVTISSDNFVKISPNDNLYINVTSSNPEAVAMFNIMDLASSGQGLAVQGYLVDKNGYINFPVLGKIRLGGMTKERAIAYLQERVTEYVKDAIVNIRFLNFKISILGEVNKPGTYFINDEKISIIEFLSMAGDLTIFGKRENILICREVNGKVNSQRIDLTSPKLFESDYFYLQQNDVVYVQPNKAKSQSATNRRANLSLTLTLLSFVVTILTYITIYNNN